MIMDLLLVMASLMLFQTDCVPPVITPNEPLVLTQCLGVNPTVIKCMTNKNHQVYIKLVPMVDLAGYDEQPMQQNTPYWLRDLKQDCHWDKMDSTGKKMETTTEHKGG